MVVCYCVCLFVCLLFFLNILITNNQAGLVSTNGVPSVCTNNKRYISGMVL